MYVVGKMNVVVLKGQVIMAVLTLPQTGSGLKAFSRMFIQSEPAVGLPSPPMSCFTIVWQTGSPAA